MAYIIVDFGFCEVINGSFSTNDHKHALIIPSFWRGAYLLVALSVPQSSEYYDVTDSEEECSPLALFSKEYILRAIRLRSLQYITS